MSSGGKKHLLIVEDSRDLQELLFQLFEAEGYQISQAYNGQEALDLLRSLPELPSLILLDIMMPVMDGIEFRFELKRDARLAGIPVIVMTADSNFQSKVEKMEVDDYFRKPILDIEKLIDAVERCSRKDPPVH